MKCIVCKSIDIELKTVDEQIRKGRDNILVPMDKRMILTAPDTDICISVYFCSKLKNPKNPVCIMMITPSERKGTNI